MTFTAKPHARKPGLLNNLLDNLSRDKSTYLHRVMDNMLGFVAVLDAEGTLLDVNKAALGVAGLTLEDVRGKKFWDCYWWSYDPEVSFQMKSSIRRAATGDTERYDIAVRIVNDRRLLVDFMLAPVYDEAGDLIYLIPSGVDITERRRVEFERESLLANLEQQVKTRTAELRNLARQLTLAESRERERIAQTLHDTVQQELFSLQFPLATLKRDLESHGAYETLIEMEATLRNAIRLTRSVTRDLNPVAADDSDIISALQTVVENKSDKYGLEVELVGPESYHVGNEAVRLLIVSLTKEFLFNVFKHAGVDRAKLALDINDGLTLTVSDQGKGMDTTDILVLSSGTGYGLSGALDRVSLLGGTLDIRSEPGNGTFVIVSFPHISLD